MRLTSTSFADGGAIPAEYAFCAPDAKTQFGVTLQGDAMFTKYFNALFITQRTAVYATLAFDAEFD